jgi:hypothetical protein
MRVPQIGISIDLLSNDGHVDEEKGNGICGIT